MGKLCRKIWAAWNVVLLFICRLTAAFVGRRGDNILIARSDAIGDFVVFGECLERLVKQLHPAGVDVMIRRDVAPLLEALPGVRKRIAWDPGRFRRNPFYRLLLVSRLARNGYGTAINPQATHHLYDDHLVCSVGAREVVGFDISPETPAIVRQMRRYYTRMISPSAEQPNELARCAELLDAFGAQVPVKGLRPKVFLTDEDGREAQRLLAPVSGSGCLVCLMPGCREPIRRWPLERYVRVAKELRRRFPDKVRFVVLGSRGEKPLASAIVDGIGPCALNLAGMTGVRVLAAVIGMCDLYIGLETGAAHMAVAMNTPGVVILGGGHFGRFFPRPGPVRAVYRRLPCYNCNWSCVRGRAECMLAIQAKEVVDAAADVIERHDILGREARLLKQERET